MKKEQVNIMDDLELIQNHIIKTQQEYRRLEMQFKTLEF